MEKKSPIWSFLEALDDFSAPLIDWKNALKEKHDIDKFRYCFLSSSDKFAKSIRCFSPCDKPCPRRVIWDETKHIEAVCEERLNTRELLDEQDILIYRFKESKLHESLAKVFSFSLNERHLSDNRRYYMGEYKPFAGISCPVYMSYCNYTAGMSGMVKNLCLKHDGPFILMSTSRRFLTPDMELCLKKLGAVFISLEDELVIDKQCNISLRRKKEELLAPIIDKEENPSQEFFPTPPDATWENISLHFIDEHTVTIQIGEKSFTKNYFQMGMANALSNAPVDRWKFLLKLAEGNGVYITAGRGLPQSDKKQKQLLCESLAEFFRLKGEAVYWNYERKAYVARFKIRPDTHSTKWKGKRDPESIVLRP